MRTSLREARILVVEDSVDTRLIVKQQLEHVGYEVQTAENGVQALDIVSRYGMPDLVLLDILMSGMNGLEFAEKMRKMGDVPIVFLSALTDMETKIASLAQYGDDYITKPVEAPLLVARVARALKRYAGHEMADHEVEISADIRANFAKRYVLVGDRLAKLTPTEVRLLQMLYRHQGKIVAREQLLTEVDSPDILFVNIRRLRTKIEPDPANPKVIQTVRGHGYVLA